MGNQLDRLKVALADRYAIDRELGSGGMATVYLASDLRHDRQVAVKVLRPDLSAALGPERFLREIKIAAQLHHPHILPLYDSGEADGFLYYVMPYEEGQSLRERLATTGELPVLEAVRLMRDIVDALAHAHQRGVVHRDIKPDNVMLSDRHALVTDFGIAKAVSEATGRHQVTTAGVALGTPTYMSPEQAVADPHVDHRADIYAVGALAYEMLSGRPPFSGTSAQMILAAHVTEAPEPVTKHRESVPPALNHAIMRCLEKKPADRWQSAEELLAQLEALATPSGGTTPTGTTPAASPTKPGTRAAMMAIPLGALVIAAVVMVRGREPPAFEIGRTTQFTRDPGLEIDPAISPDGRMVAFVSGPVGQMRAYVRQIAGGRLFPLAESLAGHHRRPEWSPDGTEIAFQSGGVIYVMPALGGVPRRLIDPAGRGGVHSHAWSPDGSEIAFVEDSIIYVQPAGRGVRRALTGASEPHSLSWSPDGSFIAFVSGNRPFVYGTVNFANIAPSAIWTVSSDGGDPLRVTQNAFLDVSPVWSPDGRSLLFVSNRGGARDIYQIPVSARGLPERAAKRRTTGLNAHTISLTDDGTRLAYSLFTYQANIWSIPIPSGSAVAIREASPVTVGNQAIEGIAASPDGTWLVFDSDRGGNQDIYKRPLEGGDLQQLTSDPNDDFLPVWSPDGSRIAFYSFRNGSRDLYVMSADGGQLRQLTDDPGQERSPDWAPDSEHLVFHGDRTGRYEVWIISVSDPSTPRQLTFDGGSQARWSPDGRFIAYLHEGPPTHLRIVSADGGDPVTLINNQDPAITARPEELRWSADSREIYYKAYGADGISSFWAVPVTGGEPRLLVRFDDPAMHSNRDDFASDGRNLYFTIGAMESDVWVMELVGN